MMVEDLGLTAGRGSWDRLNVYDNTKTLLWRKIILTLLVLLVSVDVVRSEVRLKWRRAFRHFAAPISFHLAF